MVHAMALLIFLQCPRAIVSCVKSYAQLWGGGGEEREIASSSSFGLVKETSKIKNALKFQLVKLIT